MLLPPIPAPKMKDSCSFAHSALRTIAHGSSRFCSEKFMTLFGRYQKLGRVAVRNSSHAAHLCVLATSFVLHSWGNKIMKTLSDKGSWDRQ
jgi:hypothetical protein